jgi:hypothetical protein
LDGPEPKRPSVGLSSAGIRMGAASVTAGLSFVGRWSLPTTLSAHGQSSTGREVVRERSRSSPRREGRDY